MPFVPFTDEQLQDLENRFGRIEKVTAPKPERKSYHKTDPEIPWEVVYRAPTMGECDKFEGDANNERSKPAALRELARKMVVAISHKGTVTIHDGERGRRSKAIDDAWEKLRSDYPGVHLAGQVKIMALMGGEAEEGGKE